MYSITVCLLHNLVVIATKRLRGEQISLGGMLGGELSFNHNQLD